MLMGRQRMLVGRELALLGRNGTLQCLHPYLQRFASYVALFKISASAEGNSSNTEYCSDSSPIHFDPPSRATATPRNAVTPQRALVAGRRLSSKPPTTAGHDTREGLKRPLQARGSPDCLVC